MAGWGKAVRGSARTCRPTSPEDVSKVFATLGADGGSLCLRAAGCSYGDAAMNSGGQVMDLTGLDKILAFDPDTGIARVESGVTIRQLWRRTIAHGWWPAVVPGTMDVSVGGAAAMNIHGKNNYAVGGFGDHVRAFTLALPSGEILSCDRQNNVEIFHAAIGGFGMLGCFLEIELQLKKVHSGRLRITTHAARHLGHAIEIFDQQGEGADYLVGWHDAYARGEQLGRGTIHRGELLAEGEDLEGQKMMSAEQQDVPARMFGVVPKAWIWPGMWLMRRCGGTRWVNAAKYHMGVREAKRPPHLQSHGAFHFLLDYVPGWNKMLSPGGLIQFQPFVPVSEAESVLTRAIEWSQQAGLLPYLLVLKRHRPDPFLMTHAVDGFSMAMDFGVTRGNRDRLWAHCRRMSEMVLEAGGRFYYAKDATLDSTAFPRIHGADAVAEFRRLKARCDPQGILQSDLSRRLMGT